MMNILAIDVGTGHIGICKWEAGEMFTYSAPVCGPEEGWEQWLAVAQPSPPYQVLYRCTNENYETARSAEAIRSLATQHGARWLRLLSDAAAADPALAAARDTARRHRIGVFCLAEIGAGHTTIALVGPRGDLLMQVERTCRTSAASRVIAARETLGRLASWEEMAACTLVCFGGEGPPCATELADACGIASVLIPHHAAAAATIGMLTADIVMHFDRPCVMSPIDLRSLRQAFRELMDETATSITMEGHDLDDTVCRRSARMSFTDAEGEFEVPCDDLADEDALIAGFASGVGLRVQPEFRRLVVHRIRVEATIKAFELETCLPRAARGSVADAAIDEGPSLARAVVAEARVFARERIPADGVVVGPAEIREPGTATFVPEGWTCRLSGVGALRLTRA